MNFDLLFPTSLLCVALLLQHVRACILEKRVNQCIELIQNLNKITQSLADFDTMQAQINMDIKNAVRSLRQNALVLAK